MNKLAKTLITVAVAGAAVFSMSACSGTGDQTHTISPIPEPKTIDLLSYGGEAIDITAGQSIIINVENGTQADWTGKSSDEKVAVFISGIYTDNVVATPSINVLSAGKAKVTLTNEKTKTEKVVQIEAKK